MFSSRKILYYIGLFVFVLFSIGATQEVSDFENLISGVLMVVYILNIVFFALLLQKQNELKKYDSKSYTPTIWYIVIGLFFFSCVFSVFSLIMVLIQFSRINSILGSYQQKKNLMIRTTQYATAQTFGLNNPNYYNALPPELPPPLPKSDLKEENSGTCLTSNSGSNESRESSESSELEVLEDNTDSFVVKFNEKEDSFEYYFDKTMVGYYDRIFINQCGYVNEGGTILRVRKSSSEVIDFFAKQSGWVFYKKTIKYGEFFSYTYDQSFLIVYKTEESLLNAQFNNTVVLDNDLFTKRPCIIGKKYGGSLDGFLFGPFLVYPEYNNGEHRFIILYSGRTFCLYKNYSIVILMESGKLINIDKLVRPTKNNNNVYKEKTYSVITIEDIELLGLEDIQRIRVLNNEGNVEIECDPFEKHSNSRIIQKVFKDYINKYLSLFKTIDPADYKNPSVVENIKEKKCYVYLMLDEVNLYYKIGISNRPKFRERTLQSEKPTIKLICCKEFPTRKIAESFEKALHNAYREKRIRGEWFKLDDNDIKELKETLNGE